MVGRLVSFWTGPFSGDILIFVRGIVYSLRILTRQKWLSCEDLYTPAENTFKPFHWRVQWFLGLWHHLVILRCVFFWVSPSRLPFRTFAARMARWEVCRCLGAKMVREPIDIPTWVPKWWFSKGKSPEFSGKSGLVRYDSMWPDQHVPKNKTQIALRKSCFCFGGSRSVWDTPSLLITSWAGHLRGFKFPF